jgi:FMN phosphatase YigB (HAD superfamily)
LMEKRFDLVLFDIGGVIAEIDRDALVGAAAIAEVDPRPGLSFWRSAYDAGTDDDHPFHRAERGEIANSEFLSLAEAAVPGASFLLDPESPAHLMRFVSPSAGWSQFAEAARTEGIRIGALSNTMDGLAWVDVMRANPSMGLHVQGLFGDDILESHVLGQRKPNQAAFIAATDYFDVRPDRVLFIDDETGNCRGAEAVGIVAVHAEAPGAQQNARNLLFQ